MSNPIVTDQHNHTDLEIAQIALLLTDMLAGPSSKSLSAEAVFRRIVDDRTQSAAAPDAPFPSLVIVQTRRCGAPAANGVDKFALEYVCASGAERYDEMVVQEFARWSSTTNVTCNECVSRYFARQQRFTFDTLAPRLTAIGYASLGVVQGQQFVNGFPTPLVYSAFTRDGGLAIVAGHAPHDADAAGGPTTIRELRLYFPVREEQ